MSETSPHLNEELVRSMYAAFGRRDMAQVRHMLDDDVVFHVPGHHQLAGDYRGPVEVFEFFARQGELADEGPRVEVHDVLANDEHAVALVVVHVARETRTLDIPAAHVMHVADGRIAELWIHPTDQDAVDAFWS